MFMLYFLGIHRSSHQRCSRKKSALTNLAKIKGEHLCQSLFFNKVEGQRPEACNFIKKKRLWHRCFPLDIANFVQAPFSWSTSA